MNTEEISVEENEKITVTKQKRQPTEKQLKALEKARNLKSIKKEAVKIVNKSQENKEIKIEKAQNNFFLYATMGMTAIAATLIIMNNSKLITESQKYKEIKDQILKKQEDVVVEPIMEKKIEPIIEKPIPSQLEEQLNQPLKKVPKYSSLQLEF